LTTLLTDVVPQTW